MASQGTSDEQMLRLMQLSGKFDSLKQETSGMSDVAETRGKGKPL